MKIGLKPRKDYAKWHSWFAWHPIIIPIEAPYSSHTNADRWVVFLQTVERRYPGGYSMEYRLRSPNETPD